MKKEKDDKTDLKESEKNTEQETIVEDKDISAEPPAPLKRRSLLTHVLLNIAVTVIMLYGAAYYWPQIDKQVIAYMPWNMKAPGKQGQHKSSEIEQLKIKLKKAEGAISALAKEITSPAASETTIKHFVEKLTQRVNKLETSIIKLQAAKPSAGAPAKLSNEITTQIKTLSAQLAQLRNDVEETLKVTIRQQEMRITMMRYFSKLQSQLIASKTYEEPLNALIKKAEENQLYTVLKAAKPLQKMASSGYPSAGSLKEYFNRIMNQQTAKAAPQTDNLQDKIFSNLEKLVQVRRVDSKGSTKDAILTRAENAIAAGEIEQALLEITHLPADQQTRWQPWIESVEAYLNAPQAMTELENAIFTAAKNK